MREVQAVKDLLSGTISIGKAAIKVTTPTIEGEIVKKNITKDNSGGNGDEDVEEADEEKAAEEAAIEEVVEEEKVEETPEMKAYNEKQAKLKALRDEEAAAGIADLQEGCWRLWRFIMEIAREFPNTHDKLVDLIVTISQLPEAERTVNGKTRKAIIWDTQVLWRDMPAWGPIWAEFGFNCKWEKAYSL